MTNKTEPKAAIHPRMGPGRGPGRGPMVGIPTEKPKNLMATLRRLLRYLKPFGLQLSIAMVATVLAAGFNILTPKFIGLATSRIYQGVTEKLRGKPEAAIDFDYVIKILLILAVLYIVSAVFNYLQQLIMAIVAQKTVYSMRSDISQKLPRLPLRFFDAYTHGEILSRITNDIDNISNTLQQSIIQIGTAIITLLGITVMMLTISPFMTLILVITLPLYALITRMIAKRSQKYFSQQQKTLGELNGHIEETYTGHEIIKAFSREKQSIETFTRLNEELYTVAWKAHFISGIIMPLMSFVNEIGYVFIAVLGGILVTRKAVLIGDVQAFLQYSRQFSRPIIQTANIANILQSTLASAERVFELLDEQEEVPDLPQNKLIQKPQGRVVFQNVSFGYKKDVTVINNLSIEVKSGQTVAIVGPTGAGKTTLVNLLMRFYEIDRGKITIDGIDIRKLKKKDLRSIFAMVLQDTWLFNGTITENIAYGRKGATTAEIIQAAQYAHADHFIRTLPDGYETILGEEAANISQGQKQLLTIARAFLADAKILILDEATSSVDTRTEVFIQRAMKTLMQGRTSFVIAHRLSTIKEADLILVMDKGKIVEKGTHTQLLAQNGFYADLYNSQFAASIVS